MLEQMLAILVILAGYMAAVAINRRFPRMQPLFVAVVLVWLCWTAFGGEWDAFSSGGSWISFWLGPATVALAVPLAANIRQFASIWRGVLLGVGAGCAIALFSNLLIYWTIGFPKSVMLSMLSKSVTTPISLELTRNIGGIPELAAFFTALTGFLGAMMAPPVLRRAGISDDRAIGIAVGTSAHAIGTASLNRNSPVQTASSSIAMIVAGVVTSLYLIPFQ